MPRPRFDKLPDDKRRRILDAAAFAFAAHGFDGASLNQIIESAGISKGAVYYYFDDKADLLATVLLDVWEQLMPLDDIDVGVLTAQTFWPAIEAWYDRAIVAMRAMPWLVGLGKLTYRLPPTVLQGTVFAERLERAVAVLGSVVMRGRELDVVRTDLPAGLVLAILAGAAEASDRWMVDNFEAIGLEEMEAVSYRLFRVFREIAEPRTAAEGGGG